MKLNYIVNSNQYQTVKQVLKAHFHLSDRLILRLKRHNQIFVNENHAFVYTPIHLNDCVWVDLFSDEKSENILPTNMNLSIIFEDEAMLIVNKPAGIPVHPSMAHFSDSLSNGVQAYFEKNKIQTKIRPVNRLDKDTSGLVIFAKNEYVQECFIHQMKNHVFKKYYQALLCGNLDSSNQSGVIHAPIARKSGSIIEREVNANGQTAITHYKVIQNYPNFCLVEFKLETGRTHQIRVHSKYMGHPILGDTLYGTASELIGRQALHAYKIVFEHPITHTPMEFKIAFPDDIFSLIS